MTRASVIFLTYNQEKFVSEALRAALEQDFDDYEIIIADDGSTDATSEIISRLVDTHARRHLVRFLPKEPNMGLVRNWNRAIAAARGEVLVVMAGDDISSADRLAVTFQIFKDNPEVMVVMSQVSIINESGDEIVAEWELQRRADSIHRASADSFGLDFWYGAPTLGACGSYRRVLSTAFSPIDAAKAEDEVFIYRGFLLGSLAYTPKNLVKWRWHGRNLSMGAWSEVDAPATTLATVAKFYQGRAEYCEQFRKDSQQAYDQGLLTADRLESERAKIRKYEAALRLGFLTISPTAKWVPWLAAAGRFLLSHSLTWRAWRHVVISGIKFSLPITQKVRHFSPARPTSPNQKT
jgi:glycosyltransferase involved in cell wall biosynthesis